MAAATMVVSPDEALKRCTACGSLLPAPAFHRRTKSPDGRASVCRRCAYRRRPPESHSRQRNEMRAAIKAGDFEQFCTLYADAVGESNSWLAIAVQNYNTVRKHVGHAHIVEFLLAHGAQPDGGTFLEAARDGCQANVDRLLAGNSEPDIFACSAIGDPELIAQHLQRDARLAQARMPQDIKNYREFTPLHGCCLSALGRHSPAHENRLLEVAKLLATHGADINAQGTFYGSLRVTPLDMLAHTGGNLALAQFLIARGARTSAFAFLEALAHRGRSVKDGLALASLFLASGYEIDSQSDGRTALHAAANAGVPTIVEWLLEQGADVDARGRLGRTPLQLAAERNTSTKTVALLVAHGANVHAQDDQGLTAVEIAEQQGKTVVAEWLKKSIGNSTR